nr:MAG TPA: hypothetical protein [Caudoviricetes sp.]
MNQLLQYLFHQNILTNPKCLFHHHILLFLYSRHQW